MPLPLKKIIKRILKNYTKPKSIHYKEAIYFLKHALKEFPNFIKDIYLFSNSTKETSCGFQMKIHDGEKVLHRSISVGKKKEAKFMILNDLEDKLSW